MKTRARSCRKNTKKLTRHIQQQLQLQAQDQAQAETRSQIIISHDPQIQYSNSQLSHTLSVSYNPKQIKCRQQQKIIITKFVKNCLSSKGTQGSRVLYISGVPGVGKTISVMQVVNNIKKHIHYRKAVFKYVNALKITIPSNIYNIIYKQLYPIQKNNPKPKQTTTPLKLIQKLQQDKRIKFIIIDQIDYLYTRNQNILYNIFQWCNLVNTGLCTIVIANTMDFPQRLQPKITSRMGTNRLIFKPYSYQQVQLILQQRLMKSNRFSKDAILYTCKKMSSFTSDVRKLLDILTMALQSKNNGIIEVEDMVKFWRIAAQQSGHLWQQQIPEYYKIIMNVIKQKGGITTDVKVYQYMNIKNGSQREEIVYYLRMMEEMRIVKIKEKKGKGMKYLEVTLLIL